MSGCNQRYEWRVVRQAINGAAVDAAASPDLPRPFGLAQFRDAVILALQDRVRAATGSPRNNYAMAADTLKELQPDRLSAIKLTGRDASKSATGILINLARTWWFENMPLTAAELVDNRLTRLCREAGFGPKGAERSYCTWSEFTALAARVSPTDNELGRATPLRTAMYLQSVCRQSHQPHVPVGPNPIGGQPPLDMPTLLDLQDCMDRLQAGHPQAWAAVVIESGIRARLGQAEEDAHYSDAERTLGLVTDEIYDALVSEARKLLRNCMAGKGL